MLAALAAFAAQAAVVYKWTDADGVVHYSDQPVPGAEKIHHVVRLAQWQRLRPRARTWTCRRPAPRKRRRRLDYTEFAIASPAADQTFFGDEVINVRLTLEPALKPNQTITWHLNGKQLDGSGTERDSIHAAALGSRHLRDRRDHHGSAIRRIAQHRQRHLLRSAAVRAVAAAPEALAPLFGRRGRTAWPLNSSWTCRTSTAPSCSMAW